MKRLKFIDFEYFYKVYNIKKSEFLGDIQYYKNWKKWIWAQDIGVMMSWDCLQEVVDFMKTIQMRGKE